MQVQMWLNAVLKFVYYNYIKKLIRLCKQTLAGCESG